MVASAICPNCQAAVAEGTKQCLACGAILAVAAPIDPLIGAVVGNLVLVARLGAGGMGAVYRAEHRSLKTPYAVKVLHRQFSDNPTTAERFRREAVTCSQLRHENVVFVTDFGIQDDIGIYIVMEYLEGHSLSQLLRQAGTLPVGRIGRIGEQICDAMAAAHHLDIVHRDLKPDNVIVLADPRRRDFVKVLDFGIAHIRAGQGEKQLTQAGLTMGTPTYIAPEQIIGKAGSIGPAADIYSLGVMFYEMLTGAPPFAQGESEFELLSQHMSTPAPLLSTRTPALGGSRLEALLAAMLEKKPDRRPSSMAEVRRLLGEAVAEQRDLGNPDALPGSDAPAATTAPSAATANPGTRSSPSLHVTTLIRRIKLEAPESAAAALLKALPNADSLGGEALALALWGVLQQEILDTPLDAPSFAVAAGQLLLLVQAVLMSTTKAQATESQEKIFRSLRNLMTLSEKDRQKRLVEALQPILGHPLFPADALPKWAAPNRSSGGWQAIKSVMTKEIKIPWSDGGAEATPKDGDETQERATAPEKATAKSPEKAPEKAAAKAGGEDGASAAESLLDKLSQPVTVGSLKSVLTHEFRLFGKGKPKE